MKNLTEKSLLVGLIISQWSARKYDRKVTAEVNANHNSKDAGRFNKLLIASERLQAITKVATKAREFHYQNTLPWSDSGERLLPAKNYFQYIGELSKLKNEFESEVRKFILEYPTMIEDAKINLNGLFNHADYPNDIGDKFRIKTTFMPVPETDDLRIDLSTEEVSKIRESIEGEMNDRFANAQKNIYERISEQLKKMYERLKDKEAVFRDSLFDNVLSLVDLLPRLNVSEDQNINDLCNDLKALYCDPETVRTNVKKRKDKAAEVQAMLNKMDAFFKPA